MHNASASSELHPDGLLVRTETCFVSLSHRTALSAKVTIFLNTHSRAHRLGAFPAPAYRMPYPPWGQRHSIRAPRVPKRGAVPNGGTDAWPTFIRRGAPNLGQRPSGREQGFQNAGTCAMLFKFRTGAAFAMCSLYRYTFIVKQSAHVHGDPEPRALT
jgi:hypothetical protein